MGLVVIDYDFRLGSNDQMSALLLGASMVDEHGMIYEVGLIKCYRLWCCMCCDVAHIDQDSVYGVSRILYTKNPAQCVAGFF